VFNGLNIRTVEDQLDEIMPMQ